MDCARIDLVAYYFGALVDEERGEAERHLLSCAACLGAYMALKRHTEDRARAERPSDEVRARLRRDVAAAFPRRTPWLEWLARPIPLYQGIAAATLALLAASVVPLVAHEWRPARPGGERVDTARRTAESFAIY